MDPITVIKVASKVKTVADTVNTVAKATGKNQDSVFAQKEKEGKGGAINSVFQAADTLTGGTIGKVASAIDDKTGGKASKIVQTADKVVSPVMDAADKIGGSGTVDAAKASKLPKKMPDLNA